MTTKTRQILTHVIGCIAFMAIPLLISPDLSRGVAMFNVPHLHRDLIFYALLLLFFYAAYYYLIPKFYFTRNYLLFFGIVVLAFIFIYFISELADSHTPPPHHGGMPAHPGMRPPPPKGMRPGSFLIRFAGNVLFPFLVVFITSLLMRIRLRLQEYEKEKKQAELSYLKAQINPHFLFNSLNSIYALALEKSDQAPEAVLKLSGMMRYVLNDAKQEFVTLEKEIAYINDYVALQRIRLGDTVNISYNVSGNATGYKIAPLVVIAFIENAFKYGVNPEEVSKIEIVLQSSNGNFRMQVKNNKVKTLSFPEEKNEIGIPNTRQRLQFLYPGKHELTINDSQNTFEVILEIRLND